MPSADNVKNCVDGRTYQVSTCETTCGTSMARMRAAARQTPFIWEHDVTRLGRFLGLGSKQVYAAVSRDEPSAKAEHARLVALARDADPAQWCMTSAQLNEVSATVARLANELGTKR